MSLKDWRVVVFVIGTLSTSSALAKSVHYELVATKSPVNLSGKKTVDFALQVNGSIPAPTLEFVEGDDAEIVVKNRIPGEELSIHWHGILLPVEMDGVPYVTTPPIPSGGEFTYRFKIRQNGTYWYHSHTNVQEQKGVYGAIVIQPQKPRIKVDRDVIVVLSDWTDEDPAQVLRNLKKDGDYYQYKKGTIRSWFGAIRSGGFAAYLYNDWTRMGGMDLSDVGYDAFLINGRRESVVLPGEPGEKIRLRIVNAAGSSYFYVALGQRPMRVIAADGVDISPVLAKELLMGMAETYDVLVDVPRDTSLELRVSAQDGTGAVSAFLGRGDGATEKKEAAPTRPAPELYEIMDHENHANHEAHANHTSHTSPHAQGAHHAHAHAGEHDVPMKTVDVLTVDALSAPDPTELSAKAPRHDLKLVIGGDMARYVWHLNGKAIHQDRTIEVREGDVVRMTFENETMMHHPMHLHGHFFRVINAAGERSPLKHTVDVPPHGSRTIEFIANEPGEWMLHCHNLYHLKSGMARVVKYLSYTPAPHLQHLQKHDPHNHDHWYFYGRGEAATNHAQANLRLSQTWNEFDGRVEARNLDGKNFHFDQPWEVESDLFYRRWISNYLSLLGGGVLFDKKVSAALGLSYLLPFRIETKVFVLHRKQFRMDLSKRFQWFSHVYSDIDFIWRPKQAENHGSDAEFEATLMYSPWWSIAGGLMITDRSIGAGIQIQL